MLFLATFNTVLTPYDGDGSSREPTTESHIRLVEATDEGDASAKIEKTYEFHSPGSDSVRVSGLAVTEVLK